jgi:hypothetical protein
VTRAEMAKGGGERGALLPVSADDGKGNGGGGAGEDAALFKGSAMTRRGAVAALSYMACSGTCRARSAPSRAVLAASFGGGAVTGRGWGRVALFVRFSEFGVGTWESTCITCRGLVACASRHAFCRIQLLAFWGSCRMVDLGFEFFRNTTELLGADHFRNSLATGYTESA